LNGKSATGGKILSGVMQGSVLCPIETGAMNWILKFADKTQIFAQINTASGGLKLQRDLQKLN